MNFTLKVGTTLESQLKGVDDCGFLKGVFQRKAFFFFLTEKNGVGHEKLRR